MSMFYRHNRGGKRLQRKPKSESSSGVRLAALLLCLSMLMGLSCGNEWYAKDISRKVRSSKKLRGNAGDPMAGGFAKIAPHRLYRGPETALASSGSWRALCVCPCGDPYC